MKDMTLLATASFGLEAVVKREIETLGYEVTAASDDTPFSLPSTSTVNAPPVPVT